LEEEIEIARQLMMGLLERMGVGKEVEGFLIGGDLYLEIKGDLEGVLIGRHGRTLDALQMLISRMVHKKLKRPLKVVLDIDGYRKRRTDILTQMAFRIGEKARGTGHVMTIGPFNAHDRRIIHMVFKEDPSIRTESIGEGEVKKITIIPKKKEEGKIDSFAKS
jgi:spoIIIJ-associated protein